MKYESYESFRDALMLKCAPQGLPVIHCKAGGNTKPQQTTGKTGTSRAYAGFTNISGAVKAQAEVIEREELFPAQQAMYSAQSKRIAQGKGARFLRRELKLIEEIQGRVSALKKDAQAMAVVVRKAPKHG